jgi:hypothetical protein
MKMLKLKNGSEELEPTVIAVMNVLHNMINSGIDCIAVYELVEKCKDNKHVLFGNAGEKLQKFGLIDKNGSIHESIKNIVLSAVEGDGMDMSIGNPIKSD